MMAALSQDSARSFNTDIEIYLCETFPIDVRNAPFSRVPTLNQHF